MARSSSGGHAFPLRGQDSPPEVRHLPCRTVREGCCSAGAGSALDAAGNFLGAFLRGHGDFAKELFNDLIRTDTFAVGLERRQNSVS